MLVTPEDETLQNSSDIIDALERRFPEAPTYPAGPRQRVMALLFELFGDEWLKLPAMYYRWNRNAHWIVACRPFRGSLPVLGVNAETASAIEASYKALLAELEAHFAAQEFLVGKRPSIGDYGLIGPLCAHQFHDPVSGALMWRLAPNVVRWVQQMIDPSQPLAGQFLADDAVPETLLPVLRRLAGECLPVVHSTIIALDAWLDAHPGGALPRTIGTHAVTLGRGTAAEVTSERAIFPFDPWMFQRPLDTFRALPVGEPAAVVALLRRAGAASVFDVAPRHRLRRRNFQLVVESVA